MYRNVKELKKQGFVLRHGNLNKLLEESKSSWQHTSMKSADIVSNTAKLLIMFSTPI